MKKGRNFFLQLPPFLSTYLVGDAKIVSYQSSPKLPPPTSSCTLAAVSKANQAVLISLFFQVEILASSLYL